ncbi:M penetrans family 1 protein [Epilithonimonas vandammei]|jgi:hypothetical protein|uniref:M penetrans family 1 protein n=1 Tax=Epilithonimonas vandammei TaxID=2487072 RepID=A0A3G8Z9T9_9FLAO|nr:DUF6702 family protein [Epilithonimonas vandammei]AZI38489.1 M penetrans family 1 protein [Epilithonimonas vandammei]AZI54179.1 M penetrans family 1 protein [Epilithonimonas vandammei]
MKKSIFILSLGVLLLSLFSFKDFDFFSSMTKVDYIDGSKTLKFTTKLNTTHISQAVKIDPNTAAFEAELKKYINNNIDISVNGNPKNLTFTGSQVNGESVWIYYEISNVSEISKLRIRNNILISQFPKQVNIMNITYKGILRTVNFQKGKETSEIDF